jgi:hypothetical protein
MTLGVAAIVLLSYLTLNRPPPPRFTAPATADATSTATAPPKATARSKAAAALETAGADQARVLVVGDGFSTPPASGQGWPELVRSDLNSAGRPIETVVAAADQAGYAEPDADGATFGRLVQEAGGGFDLVVFFGSRFDIAAAGDVEDAAAAAFAAAQAASPEATLLVIGPAWPDAGPPGYIVTNRDAVAAAAGGSGAAFGDPLADGWFVGTDAALIDPDGVRPTAEGHRYLADLIGPVIERVLAERG